jgi:hypothetical protein
VRRGELDYFFGCTDAHNRSAFVSSFRLHVYDVVGAFDDIYAITHNSVIGISSPKPFVVYIRIIIAEYYFAILLYFSERRHIPRPLKKIFRGFGALIS